MIRNFRHNGLRRFWERGERRRIPSEYTVKIQRILDILDEAMMPDDMNRRGFGLHRLTGDRGGYWAVTVSANWRVVFRFQEGDVCDVDLIDYH